MAKLTDVAGIGPVTATVLANHHIKTPEALAAASITDLEKIPGFSVLRAKAVKKAATDCLLSNKNKKASTTTGKQSNEKNTKSKGADTSVPEVSLDSVSQKEKHKRIKSNKKEESRNNIKAKEKINAEGKIKKKNKIKKEKNKDKKKKAKKKS